MLSSVLHGYCTHMHACAHARTCTHIYSHTHTHSRTHTHSLMHVHTHTHTPHTHTNTHAQRDECTTITTTILLWIHCNTTCVNLAPKITWGSACPGAEGPGPAFSWFYLVKLVVANGWAGRPRRDFRFPSMGPWQEGGFRINLTGVGVGGDVGGVGAERSSPELQERKYTMRKNQGRVLPPPPPTGSGVAEMEYRF